MADLAQFLPNGFEALTYYDSNALFATGQAAEIFLAWLGSKEGATVLANNLPLGFFPMSNNSISITDKHANEFLGLNNGRGTDVRWAWPELLAGEPSGYILMQDGSISVITGAITPEEAADDLLNGLAEWYLPAQR